MKILMINSVCGVKSTGRICTDLAKELEKNGHEVKIAYGREKVPSEYQKYAVRIGNDLDVKIHGLQSRLFDMAGFGSKKVTQKFIEWTKKYNPDVIHLHNIHGYYINIEILFQYLKKEFKGKIIWTLHDCWAFTGHTPYCDSINCQRWELGCYSCPLLKEYPKSYIDNSMKNWKKKKKIFQGASNLTIITPSKWLKELTEKSFLGEYEVKLINNGIDIDQFYPIESNFKKNNKIDDKYMLLSVATSWDDMKGYSDLIKLSEKLNDKYKIVLVGLNKNQIIKLPKNIIGIEKTSSIKELVEIYNAADLYLNLSYCENYPTVNIEAMACGVPVLTYDTGGSPEIIKKYGGYIVEKGDIEEVFEKIKTIVDRKKFNNIKFNKNENDKKRVLKDYIKYYLDVINYNKEEGMKKNLNILYVNGGLMDRGGISSVMMNYYLHFTDKKIKIDFVGHGYGNGERDKEIIKNGDKVFNIPPKSKNIFLNYIKLKKIMKSGKYDIVHSHADSGNAYILKIAKKCGIPIRISHSHNTNYTINNKIRILWNEIQKKEIKKYATDLWACSSEAARWLYGSKEKNVKIIHNAIETKKFCFSQLKREGIRKKYNIKDDFVIGIVGRLDYQKNHDFILKVMKEYLIKDNEAKLMIVGDGKLRESLKKKIEELGIKKNIIFVGQVQNVFDFYNAFDVLVMPSLFEGLPVSAIEAQASGLSCLISNKVTREVDLGYNLKYLDITKIKPWVEELNEIKKNKQKREKKEAYFYIQKAGYDIQEEAEKVQKIYWNLKEGVK